MPYAIKMICERKKKVKLHFRQDLKNKKKSWFKFNMMYLKDRNVCEVKRQVKKIRLKGKRFYNNKDIL